MKIKKSKILLIIICFIFFEANIISQSIYKTCADTVASFPGGETKLKEFINKNIKFPKLEDDIYGSVILSFVIDATGVVSQIKIERGLHKDFDDEAIRIVKLMPKWIPARVYNVKVRSIVYLKIFFIIH